MKILLNLMETSIIVYSAMKIHLDQSLSMKVEEPEEILEFIQKLIDQMTKFIIWHIVIIEK